MPLEPDDGLEDLWDEDLRNAINDLWEVVHDHEDDCRCHECDLLALLAFN